MSDECAASMCGRQHQMADVDIDAGTMSLCKLHQFELDAGTEVVLANGWRLYRGVDHELHVRPPRVEERV